MKPGHKYIVKTGYSWRYPDVRKIMVLEVTDSSIAYKNLDNNSDYVKRDLLENFNMDYTILEDLGGPEDEILSNLDNMGDKLGGINETDSSHSCSNCEFF